MPFQTVGIVGSEARKFTAKTQEQTWELIRSLLRVTKPELVVSGGCHLGGVDQWAVEIASHEFGIETREFLPVSRNWTGYKNRNIQIAEAADEVVCFTIKDLPPDLKEGGWERYCYHCDSHDHIKSGGCWTAKYARSIGKVGRTVVVESNAS